MGPVSKSKSKNDPLSPFRYFVRKIKDRCRRKNKKNGITASYLKSLWKSQKGICPYTNLKMTLPYHRVKGFRNKENPCRASLDRIDSSQGYVEGNVEFVCLAVNLAKNTFSKKRMIDFFKRIRKKLNLV